MRIVGAPNGKCTVRNAVVRVTVQKITVCEDLSAVQNKTRIPPHLRDSGMDCKSERRASFDGIEAIYATINYGHADYRHLPTETRCPGWACCHGDASTAIEGKPMCDQESTELWDSACKEVTDSMKAFQPQATGNDPKYEKFWQKIGSDALTAASLAV